MKALVLLHEKGEALVGVRAFKLIRYLISGGAAAATNLGALFCLVHFAHLHYLTASVIAFILSVGISFTMQKFWTFRDHEVHDIHSQFARYAIVIGANLALNTLLIYVFVAYMGMWYLLGQVLATIVIAIIGYFAYRHFVFRERALPLV